MSLYKKPSRHLSSCGVNKMRHLRDPKSAFASETPTARVLSNPAFSTQTPSSPLFPPSINCNNNNQCANTSHCHRMRKTPFESCTTNLQQLPVNVDVQHGLSLHIKAWSFKSQCLTTVARNNTVVSTFSGGASTTASGFVLKKVMSNSHGVRCCSPDARKTK